MAASLVLSGGNAITPLSLTFPSVVIVINRFTVYMPLQPELGKGCLNSCLSTLYHISLSPFHAGMGI